MALLAVKHNIEVAHRLYDNKGKCEQIHGHSMWVTLSLTGTVNEKGFMDGIEFGMLKKEFRHYLDDNFDHRLLLNAADPFAGPIYRIEEANDDSGIRYKKQEFLPGLVATLGDPTTENIAKWIYQGVRSVIGLTPHSVEVWETSVNMAKWTIADEG